MSPLVPARTFGYVIGHSSARPASGADDRYAGVAER